MARPKGSYYASTHSKRELSGVKLLMSGALGPTAVVEEALCGDNGGDGVP